MAATAQVTAGDGFVPASAGSLWYENIDIYDGSCIQLYDLLVEKRELVHELGPDGVTVLHKGVGQGCVKLVRFILVDMFDGDGKCTCSLCGADPPCILTREGLLWKTWEYWGTAVNIAVTSGSPKIVLLVKWAIDESDRCKNRALAEEPLPRKLNNIHSSNFDFAEFRKKVLSEKAGLAEEEATEIINDGGEVPDVKDDLIGENIYEVGVCDMISKCMSSSRRN